MIRQVAVAVLLMGLLSLPGCQSPWAVVRDEGEAGVAVFCSPAVADGVVYVGGCDGLYAVR